MPGPISDSYDLEFGTSSNAQDVREAVCRVRDRVAELLQHRPLKNIVQVVQADDSVEMKPVTVELSERELRILRFSLDRALESL